MVNNQAIKFIPPREVLASDTIRKHLTEKFGWDAEVDI